MAQKAEMILPKMLNGMIVRCATYSKSMNRPVARI